MLEAFILQLFGAYGSDVLVIVTGILAVITGFYAFQTWRTVKVMDKDPEWNFCQR